MVRSLGGIWRGSVHSMSRPSWRFCMNKRVTLVGFDLGTTTSRAAFVDAEVAQNAGSRRAQLGQFADRPGGETILTPFVGEYLDEVAFATWFDQCFEAARLPPKDVFGGGALLTGLAARAPNARSVADLLRSRVANAVIATADDPRLESWLAFQGSVGAISRAYPDRCLLNLDIGGGTTNAACGRGGNVEWTDWSWIGARHIAVQPGTYKLETCSPMGAQVLEKLAISKKPGDALHPSDVLRIVQTWVDELEALIDRPDLPYSANTREISFSGGVGEIVYALRAQSSVPGRTYWGDLGLDLAEGICQSERLMRRLVVPDTMGRATLYGLVEHQTQVSGSTVYLPHPERLPLGDLPILATLDGDAPEEAWGRVWSFVDAARHGAAIHVRGLGGHAARIRSFGKRLGEELERHCPNKPIVILLEENAAKAVGGYATNWGHSSRSLVVLDEVIPHAAKFAHIGRMHHGLVFVSFHGFGSKEEHDAHIEEAG